MGGLVENLKRRAEIIRAVRAFFDNRGFTEVSTPVLISAPAPEPHIDCPPCGKGFLRASPELQMKKLLAAGMDRIYQIGPCFRDGELGARHNPEFTMIEWYRLGATYLDIAADAESLRRVVEEHRDEIAAIICEPIFQAANAMNFYHPEYLREMRQRQLAYGVLCRTES